MKWSITKDKAIKSVLESLLSHFGENAFILNDYWEGDLCAVGISDHDKTRCVYISAYLKPQGVFHVELEINLGSDEQYEVVGKHEEIREDELFQLVQRHLEII